LWVLYGLFGTGRYGLFQARIKLKGIL
jgi:hypothetical protein